MLALPLKIPPGLDAPGRDVAVESILGMLQAAHSVATTGSAKIFGVEIGITTNVKDPQQLGRVKVCFPRLEGKPESDWVRVAQPAAGADRGFYWLPHVGDEVLIAFERGEANRPYVLGSLWNGKDRPMKDAYNDQNTAQMIQTKSGHQIIFSDKAGEELIIIADKSGKRALTFDCKAKKIFVEASQGDVEIVAQKKLVLECEDFEVKTSKSGKLDIGTTFDLAVADKAGIQAGPLIEMKASKIDINPSGGAGGGGGGPGPAGPGRATFRGTGGQGGGAPGPPARNLATTVAPAPPPPATEFAEMRVLDDASGAPLSNVRLSFVLADGSQVTRTTNSDGIVRVDPAPRGGFTATSSVAGKQLKETLAVVSYSGFPPGSAPPPASGSGAAPTGAASGQTGPWVIAVVEEHRVRTGETLASLARRCQLTWGQLAHFNWGTSNPNQINEHLRIDVGCTKKTQNGQNYMFDDSDDPGIVHLPIPWKLERLAGTLNHEIRVRLITPAPLPFGLCCDDAGDPIAGKVFIIMDGGQEVFSGETDADGLIRAPFPHDPRYEVLFPKYGTKRDSGR